MSVLDNCCPTLKEMMTFVGLEVAPAEAKHSNVETSSTSFLSIDPMQVNLSGYVRRKCPDIRVGRGRTSLTQTLYTSDYFPASLVLAPALKHFGCGYIGRRQIDSCHRPRPWKARKFEVFGHRHKKMSALCRQNVCGAHGARGCVEPPQSERTGQRGHFTSPQNDQKEHALSHTSNGQPHIVDPAHLESSRTQ